MTKMRAIAFTSALTMVATMVPSELIADRKGSVRHAKW